MSFEGQYDYSCTCGEVSFGHDVYGEQPKTCKCGKPFNYVRLVDTSNEEVYIGDWRFLGVGSDG